MSHFVECQTEFRDAQALIAALVAALIEYGFPEDQIEVHEQPVALYGYQGDVRPQKAHIVIRRQHVGPAANDVGWEKQPGGTFRAWISEYDGRHRFNPDARNLIKQAYACQVITRQQRSLGRSIERHPLPGGEIELTTGGYR